jgi:hypothetical protein
MSWFVGCFTSYLQELGELASRYDICLHVDLCLGGFVLPFARKLGYELSSLPLDFPSHMILLGICTLKNSVEHFIMTLLFIAVTWTKNDFFIPIKSKELNA